MGYATKRSYASAFGASRSRRVSAKKAGPVRKRQTRRNRPVRRVYRRARQAPRTRAGANKSAIFTLSRQVKTLQNQRMGPVQSHILRGAIFNSALGTEMTNFNNTAPMCFQQISRVDERAANARHEDVGTCSASPKRALSSTRCPEEANHAQPQETAHPLATPNRSAHTTPQRAMALTMRSQIGDRELMTQHK